VDKAATRAVAFAAMPKDLVVFFVVAVAVILAVQWYSMRSG
jgi:hypothetical protein